MCYEDLYMVMCSMNTFATHKLYNPYVGMCMNCDNVFIVMEVLLPYKASLVTMHFAEKVFELVKSLEPQENSTQRSTNE